MSKKISFICTTVLLTVVSLILPTTKANAIDLYISGGGGGGGAKDKLRPGGGGAGGYIGNIEIPNITGGVGNGIGAGTGGIGGG